MKKKKLIITIIFITTLLVVYSFFPIKNSFQTTIGMLTFFIIIPIIFNKFILKNNLSEIGLKIGDWKQGLIWSGISFLIGGVFYLVIIYFFDFLKHYTIPAFIVSDYENFLFYEFLLALPVIFMYDFFFRGFIMLNFKKNTYYWAIIIQTVLFFVLAAATDSIWWRLVPYLISAPLAGIITYKSGSILYATAFQFFVKFILDAEIIYLIK